MSVYPEYKRCDGDWIKEIPVDWDIVRGKYLFEIKKRIVGEIGYDVLSITQKGVKIKDTESGDGQLSMDYSKYQVVEPGDFAMNHMDLLTGYVDISKFSGVTSPDYRVFTVKEEASCSRFFLYVFQMGYTNKIFFKYGQGASHLGRWRLPTEEFSNFWFPCPPKEDRENIVDFLDYEIGRIDTLIEKQQLLIKLLKEKRQAVISHAVTKGLNPNAPMRDSGVEWLGEVPEGWGICCIKHVISPEKNSMVDGPFGSSVNTDKDYVEVGIPVIRTVNITNDGFSSENLKFMRKEKFMRLRRHAVYPGDVLFSKVGTIGNSCVLPKSVSEAILSTTGSCKITVNPAKCMPDYLVLCIQSMYEELMQIANSNVQPFLNMVNIKNLKLPLPSLVGQNEILTRLNIELKKLDEVIDKAAASAELLQERRTALISAAVTGKIDVRNWQAPESSSMVSRKDVAA